MQPKEMVCPLARRHRLELHEEIDVAVLGIERVARRRPEDRKPDDMAAPTYSGDLAFVLLHQVVHNT